MDDEHGGTTMRSALRMIPAVALISVAALIGGCGAGGTTTDPKTDDKTTNRSTKKATDKNASDKKAPKLDPTDFCANYKTYVASAMAVGFLSLGGELTASELMEAVKPMREAADNLAEHAPTEFRGEFVKARDETAKWVADLEKGNTELPKKTSEPAPENPRLDKYVEDTCGDIFAELASPEPAK